MLKLQLTRNEFTTNEAIMHLSCSSKKRAHDLPIAATLTSYRLRHEDLPTDYYIMPISSQFNSLQA